VYVAANALEAWTHAAIEAYLQSLVDRFTAI
jgi:hypothetical protein